MLDSSFPQLGCLKFLFKSIDISKCYERKLNGLKHGELFYGVYRRDSNCCSTVASTSLYIFILFAQAS